MFKNSEMGRLSWIILQGPSSHKGPCRGEQERGAGRSEGARPLGAGQGVCPWDAGCSGSRRGEGAKLPGLPGGTQCRQHFDRSK